MKLERALDIFSIVLALPFIVLFVAGATGMQLGFVLRDVLDRLLGIKNDYIG